MVFFFHKLDQQISSLGDTLIAIGEDPVNAISGIIYDGAIKWVVDFKGSWDDAVKEAEEEARGIMYALKIEMLIKSRVGLAQKLPLSLPIKLLVKILALRVIVE